MVFKCPKCEREFKTTGTETIHEKFCKGIEFKEEKHLKKPVKEKIIKKEKPVKKEDKSIENKVVCDHDYKALDSRFTHQKQAIEDGYNAYCIKCGNLI